ncbi:type-F conjugative transfer system mating-pair stabilization protein TraN [Vibrio sp. S11_S32]|uniref:type-F conjugative transfer system mating-pair stabilization protein TraN n=1 Tax=Vibrio sp. S11_S32 TaxID=2720225 RepID=UPI001681A11B|nr:type-F conjugative transfer system mating-pair stabilization protein TraN [Vibrio sp. S11_S32]MBD1576957.1 type-F conjugative transfer system mating-pair stabilization protein TraN [Vibrio sp. S11_S32]
MWIIIEQEDDMFIKKSVIIIMMIFYFKSICYADPQGDIYNQNVANAQALATMKPTTVDAHEYCSGADCGQIDSPTQSQYYGDDDATKNAATHAIRNDPFAQATIKAAPNRPKIDDNDPAYINATHDMADASEISHGKAGKYTDCTQHQQCTDTNEKRNCLIPLNDAKPECYLTPTPDQVISKQASQSFTLVKSTNVSLPLTYSPAILTQITIPRMSQLFNGDYRYGIKDPYAHVLANSVEIGKVKVVFEATHFSNHGDMLQYRATISSHTFTTHLSVQKFTLSIRSQLTKKSKFTVLNGQGKIYYSYKSQTMKWIDNCGLVPNECAAQSENCIEDGGTRTINGIPTTMSCWKKKRIYACHYDNTCSSMPKGTHGLSRYTDSSETHCTPTGEVTCSLKILGACVQNKATYTCNVKACHDANITCGEPSFCLDGDCYNPKPEQNTDFAKDAAIMAAINEGAKGIDGDSMQGFTGKAVSCSKKPIGIANCCSDKGWGMDIDLTSCSDEEKALMKAKKKKLTHKVGNYCAEKVLGVCIRHKESDCQYPNILSRLVSEQGKPQLHKTFGSAKHPDCSGFTPDEMSYIDFSQIDLTSYYDDMMANTNLPDPDDIKNKAAGDISQ